MQSYAIAELPLSPGNQQGLVLLDLVNSVFTADTSAPSQ